MKYEASLSGSNAVSVVASAKVSLTRASAITYCSNNGAKYSLMDMKHWQTIARNIASVGTNWNGGSVGTNAVNMGNYGASSASAPSSSDNSSCFGTPSSCSLTVWDKYRRTHALTNGEIIWDMAGNVEEWVSDEILDIKNPTVSSGSS